MRIIGPPPSVPGLADAIALLTALDAVETHKDKLKEFQDYLDRAAQAKADFDAAKAEAEALIEASKNTAADANTRANYASQMRADADARAAALDADRKAFTAAKNQADADAAAREAALADRERAVKVREDRAGAAMAAAEEAQSKADALIAEYTAKMDHLRQIAA